MAFVPIQLGDFVRMYLESHPDQDEATVTAQVQEALDAYNAGTRCACGKRIWVVGSLVAGLVCFQCVTGSADTSEDYEIAEACKKS